MTGRPVCTRCKVTSSLMWQRDRDGAIICLDCQAANKKTTNAPSPWVPGSVPEPGKTVKSIPKPTQPTQQPAPVPSQSEESLSVSGIATRRTTRSHERAKARQQQQQNQQSAHSLAAPPTAPPTVIPTVTVIPSSLDETKGSGTASPTPPVPPVVPVESKLDTPSPVPSGNGHNTAPAFTSRRSLRHSQPVQGAEHDPYTVTSNSIQHQVG